MSVFPFAQYHVDLPAAVRAAVLKDTGGPSPVEVYQLAQAYFDDRDAATDPDVELKSDQPIQEPLPLPAFIFEMDEFEERDKTGDELTIFTARCYGWVVLSHAVKDVNIVGRLLALKTADAIRKYDGAARDFQIYKADFDDMGERVGLADHAVWKIEFNRDLSVGLGVFQPDLDFDVSTVCISVAPDIGADNEDRYIQVEPPNG